MGYGKLVGTEINIFHKNRRRFLLIVEVQNNCILKLRPLISKAAA